MFYLTQYIFIRLNGVGHMVKDHSDSERGNPLPPLLGLLFLISSRATFGLLSSKSLRSSTNSLFFDGPSKLRRTLFIEMRTYFSFGLILRNIQNSITPQTPSTCYRSLVPASTGGPPYSLRLFFLSRTEEPAKVGICVRDSVGLRYNNLL